MAIDADTVLAPNAIEKLSPALKEPGVAAACGQDGAEYSARCDCPRGIWSDLLTREERLMKVRQCAA
jgi:cellulose synthase/poly-beta-1,6-N-acetylglucosamine synthase-like glycosyltransferase